MAHTPRGECEEVGRPHRHVFGRVTLLAACFALAALYGLTHFLGAKHLAVGWTAAAAVLVGGYAFSQTVDDVGDARRNIIVPTCIAAAALALGMLDHL